jgi:hypothetical protein
MKYFYNFELIGIFNIPENKVISANSIDEAFSKMTKYLYEHESMSGEPGESILKSKLAGIKIYLNIEQDMTELKKRIYVFSPGECICADTIKDAIDIYNKKRINYNNLEECLNTIEIYKLII